MTSVINNQGGAPPLFAELTPLAVLRLVLATAVLIGIGVAAYLQQGTAAFSLLIGAGLGIVFERGRFCFFCITRDYVEEGKSGGMFSILTALAVGGLGYAALFGIFLPNAQGNRLPPDAHIGPVSWVLLAGGLAFGFGMTLSGACISGHLYRLGQGYSRAPIALLGSLIGFGLGFFSWYDLYVGTLVRAPIWWLPRWFGYSGTLVLHVVVLGILALIFLRNLPELPAQESRKINFATLADTLFIQRWNPLATGAIVGIIGTFAYLRVEPLGVTAQLGSVSRTVLTDGGYLYERLPGLDTFSGCATQVVNTITDNGWLIGGLVLGSWAMALYGNRFQLSRLTPQNSITALLGGVLMGWGSMVSLGCTVGTLLSGISAFALSGWVFGLAVFVGLWISIRLRLHRWG